MPYEAGKHVGYKTDLASAAADANLIETLKQLRVLLGTMANLDIALSALLAGLTGAAPGSKTLADIVAALASVPITNANLDLALTGLRDALTGGGAGARTLADIVTALASVAVTGPLTDGQLRASAVAAHERPTRNAGILHRNAIAAADQLANLANTDLATADNGAGTGSLNQSTTYKITAIAYNRWGPGKVATTMNSQATAAYGANTGSIRLTIPQVTGADGYSLFLSVDAAPFWVARITEAQRASGDFEVTAVGTVAAGGGNPAGTVDINVAGTGTVQSSNGIFAQSNAWTPDAAGIVAVNCAGYTRAHVLVKAALTDLRTAPELRVLPFFANQLSGTDWHQGQGYTLQLLNGVASTLEQALTLDVGGSTGLKVLLSNLIGNGLAVTVHVELS